MSMATILIIDDAPLIRSLLQEILAWERYRVVLAANGVAHVTGANAMIPKSFEREELLEAVRTLFARTGDGMSAPPPAAPEEDR